ncbi:MAG: BACON domain-containing protein, partial [Bacteroidales bacterium]
MKIQYNTKKIFFSFATMALLSAVGCSTDNEETLLKETSKIEIKDFSFDVNQGDTTLNFFAGANWRATLSTTSWIQIDPTTKGGSKGDSKVILSWDAHTGIKEREAILTIAIDNENPYQIKITQLPNEPIVVVDKSESLLKIDTKAANGRGEFRDTLTVKSNVKWTVKELANWFEYEVLGSIEPQEGVPTTIQVVIKGNASKYNAPEMIGDFTIGKNADAALDQNIQVKAISELKVVSADNETEPVSKVYLNHSPEAGGRFVGRLRVMSNTSWAITGMPEWAFASRMDNQDGYASSLITNQVVSFTVNDANLDTEGKQQTIVIRDAKTGLESSVELIFPGTGNEYFECKLMFPPDFKFDASRFMLPSWEPIENAVLEWEFDVLSAQNYTSLDDAPYTIHFVHLMNGYFPVQMQADWLYVDPAQNMQRAALNSKKMVLSVQDRNTGMDFINNQYADRSAYMFMVPKTVAFDDLFDEATGEIKEVYMNDVRMITQKGLTLPTPETTMPDVFDFT